MQQEMEDLRLQAYKAEVAYERKQEEKRRKKQEDENKRKREEARLRKALLEAAFDDELQDLQGLLKEASQYSDEAVCAFFGCGCTSSFHWRALRHVFLAPPHPSRHSTDRQVQSAFRPGSCCIHRAFEGHSPLHLPSYSKQVLCCACAMGMAPYNYA